MTPEQKKRAREEVGDITKLTPKKLKEYEARLAKKKKEEKEKKNKPERKNPPTDKKLSRLTSKKLSRDVQTHAQIDDDIKRYGGATVALTLNSTLKAARKRADDHERNLKESIIQSKREKFKRRTREEDSKKSKETKDKLKEERKKGNPGLRQRKRK